MDIRRIFLTLFIIGIYAETAKSNLVNSVEEQMIGFAFAECSFIKSLFGLTYEKSADQAVSKMTKIFFNLYVTNDSNDTEKHFMPTAAQSLYESSNFNTSKKTIIITHGYFGDSSFDNPVSLAKYLMDLGDSNVLTLDHSYMTRDNYYLASTNTRYIGEALGAELSKLHKVGVRDFHLIGHSLGAHISGFAGKVYKNFTGDLIQRITGLDAAGPCFINEASDKRLDKTDGAFVDVIHTDMNVMGIAVPIGHVDFYPNSGGNMPGCMMMMCNHVRAFHYFIESVHMNKNGFVSVKCSSWDYFQKSSCTENPIVFMGYWFQNNVEEGLYYLKTNDNTPYALAENGLV